MNGIQGANDTVQPSLSLSGISTTISNGITGLMGNLSEKILLIADSLELQDEHDSMFDE